MSSLLESQLSTIGTRECRIFASKIFCRHVTISHYLKAAYVRDAKRRGYVFANNNLRILDNRLTHKRFTSDYLNISVTADESKILELAEVCATSVTSFYEKTAKTSDLLDVILKVESYVEDMGFSIEIGPTKTEAQRTKAIAKILKLSNAKTWKRIIKTDFNCKIESVLRDLRFVSKKKSPFVSNYSLSYYVNQQQRNKSTIEKLECVRDSDGFSISLGECIGGSVSNPNNRRNELMVRLKGYEQVANDMGYCAVFLTLTCPSRFHSTTRFGHRNPSYDGSTPRHAQDYLNNVWAKIRATWKKKSVPVFGFRVAEPHHDGTPHWHLLLFVEPRSKDLLKAEFSNFALKDSPDEPGATKYRWDCVDIDTNKGSAVGYIAKYISKNIDAKGVDISDETGESATDGSLRVRAWASTWAIRQFQQIGTVPVTVWRELRRSHGKTLYDEQKVLEISNAADSGDWAKFVELMGGAICKRIDLEIRPAYETEISKSFHDEIKRLVGVLFKSEKFYLTRIDTWSIQFKEQSSIVPHMNCEGRARARTIKSYAQRC